MTLDVLKHRLGEAEAALEQIMASPEYAYAHASSCYGASEHPIFWTVRARADELARCVADLRVQILSDCRHLRGYELRVGGSQPNRAC